MKAVTSFLFLILTYSSWAQTLPNSFDLFIQRDRDNRGKGPDTIYKENLDLIRRLNLWNPDLGKAAQERDSAKAKFISLETRLNVLTIAAQNPIVGTFAEKTYDLNGGVGFCFGRAMFIHMELVMRGLDRDSVKKAVIVGKMMGGKWGWHVTTIVQSKDIFGKRIWLALDPAMPGGVTLTEWYQSWKVHSNDNMLRLYITQSGRIGPTPSFYSHDAFENPFYNGYFTDMMEWFDSEARAGVERYLTPLTEI